MANEKIMEAVQVLITITTTLVASSGFWAFILQRQKKESALKRLLMGIAHDRITFLCMIYITRGYVSRIEYENLKDFLYTPYTELGGNGTAKRLMEEVERLPIRSRAEIKDMESTNLEHPES